LTFWSEDADQLCHDRHEGFVKSEIWGGPVLVSADQNDKGRPMVRIFKFLFVSTFLHAPFFTEHWHGGGVQHTLIEGGSLVNNADNSTSGDGTS
jgi:hypothetical protein